MTKKALMVAAGFAKNQGELSTIRPSVTCNFPGCIASKVPLNLYFREAMKLAGKVGVSLLSLLLFAVPITACALPAMATERECCRRMAQEYGNGQISFLLSDRLGAGSSACNQEFVGGWFKASDACSRTRTTADSDHRNDVGIWFIPLGS